MAGIEDGITITNANIFFDPWQYDIDCAGSKEKYSPERGRRRRKKASEPVSEKERQER
jgi:hypothetical protein